jgi:hypothetical protein
MIIKFNFSHAVSEEKIYPKSIVNVEVSILISSDLSLALYI